MFLPKGKLFWANFVEECSFQSDCQCNFKNFDPGGLVFSNDIGLSLLGILWYFPGLGIMMMVVSFHLVGKYRNLIQE